MSPRRLPATSAAMPACEGLLGDLDQPSGLGVDLADAQRNAASPCQPSTIAPQSIEMMSPSSSRYVAGDAVHDHVVRRRADHRRERGCRSRGSSSGRRAVDHVAADPSSSRGRDARAGSPRGSRRASRPRPDRPCASSSARRIVARIVASAESTRQRPCSSRSSIAETQPLEHLVGGAEAVDVTSRPRSIVPLDQRGGLRSYRSSRLWMASGGVVVALHDLAAARVADPAVRAGVDRVVAAAVLADPPAGQPLEHDSLGTSRSMTGRASIGGDRRAPRPGPRCGGSRRAGSRLVGVVAGRGAPRRCRA